MEIEVREARIDEIQKVLELWESYRQEYEALLFKKNPKFRDFLVKRSDARNVMHEELKEAVKSKDALLLIGILDGRIVGYCHSYIKDNYPIYNQQKLGHIDIFFVKRQFRGRKMSSQFRDKTYAWFRSKGITQVSLDVYLENEPAHSLYETWGFTNMCINMRKQI